MLILNGPNLNLLGSREPEIYGRETLQDIQNMCESRATYLGLTVEFRNSNAEGQLVDWIQEADKEHAALIINAGAYTHTSIAILDALKLCSLPIVEVQLSNIFQREEYRHVSYVSQSADGIISGFGSHSYELALDASAKLISSV